MTSGGFTSGDEAVAPGLGPEPHTVRIDNATIRSVIHDDYLIRVQSHHDDILHHTTIEMATKLMRHVEDSGLTCPHVGSRSRTDEQCFRFLCEASHDNFDEEKYKLQKFRARIEGWFFCLPQTLQEQLANWGFPLAATTRDGQADEFMGHSVESEEGRLRMLDWVQSNVPHLAEQLAGETGLRIAQMIEPLIRRSRQPQQQRMTATEVDARRREVWGRSPAYDSAAAHQRLQRLRDVLEGADQRTRSAYHGSAVARDEDAGQRRARVDADIYTPEPLAPPIAWNGEGPAPSFASHFDAPTEHVEERPADASPAPVVDDLGSDSDTPHPYDGFDRGRNRNQDPE